MALVCALLAGGLRVGRRHHRAEGRRGACRASDPRPIRICSSGSPCRGEAVGPRSSPPPAWRRSAGCVSPAEVLCLEQVGYVSSVSGGSVAGAYYASHKPPHEISVLTPEGALSGDYQVFFKQFREAVTQDIEGALSDAS